MRIWDSGWVREKCFVYRNFEFFFECEIECLGNAVAHAVGQVAAPEVAYAFFRDYAAEGGVGAGVALGRVGLDFLVGVGVLEQDFDTFDWRCDRFGDDPRNAAGYEVGREAREVLGGGLWGGHFVRRLGIYEF